MPQPERREVTRVHAISQVDEKGEVENFLCHF